MVVAAAHTGGPTDVVFLVEATSNLGPSFNEIKAQYISQILSHFNSTFGDDSELSVDSSNNLYALVSFTSVDAAPYPSVTCTHPTSNTHEIQEAFGFIQFTQCWNFGLSHVTEALAMGLQVLDECKKFRNKTLNMAGNTFNSMTEKHIILICNSAPYDVPTRETRPYLGLYTTDLIDKIAEREIHFSVISPRRRPALFKLFKKVSNPSLPMMNYAVDARHHVLLDSITLKEQPKVEKVTRSIIELDNSPAPETSIAPPTSLSHSILENQLKDAQAHRTSAPFGQGLVAPAVPRASQASAANTRTQETPLLTEILGSNNTNNHGSDTSQNPRTFITSSGPLTSANNTTMIGQQTMSDNQYKNHPMSQPNRQQIINQQQNMGMVNPQISQVMTSNSQVMKNTPMSMGINNQQNNQQLLNSPMSMAGSQQTSQSMMIGGQPMNNQMGNNSMSLAGSQQQSNPQMMNSSLPNSSQMAVSQQVTGSMQGMNNSTMGQINPVGLRQQLSSARHPNLGSLSSQQGQFTRSVNPNQIGQQFQTQQQQQLSQMQMNHPQQGGHIQQHQIIQQQNPNIQIQQQQSGQQNRGVPMQPQQQGKMPPMGAQGHMLPNKSQMQPGVPQPQAQQFPNMMPQQPSQPQYQVVWHGNLEFNERRSNMTGQSDRPVMMQAKIMADPASDLDLINSGGLSTWPQKIPIYPIPDVILSQSQECKRQLTSDTRKLSVFADNGPSSPFRGFVNMLIEKGMAGVVNMNSQNEYKIMVLLALKQTPTSAPTMKALLPKQQTLFYDEFKKSVHLYKEKTKQQQNARGAVARGQAPMMTNQMPVQMAGGMMNQQLGQMNPRMANPGGQRQMNPNMQTVMMGQQQAQQQMSGMMGNQMGNQMGQVGLPQQGGMQQPSQQMGNLGNQAMMGQQMGVQQRPLQNQSIMRPQMMSQHILQQRMVSQQQQQSQQMMMQQQPGQQQMMMGGNQQPGMPGQPGQPMGTSTLDDITGLY